MFVDCRFVGLKQFLYSGSSPPKKKGYICQSNRSILFLIDL